MRGLYAAGFLVCCLAPLDGRAEPLVFSATGCGPYQPAEEPLLERYLAQVGADGKSAFLVHLGDIVAGTKQVWPESEYVKVAGILKKSTIPVLIVPGDNEWNDLRNPDEGWRFWSKQFLDFEKNFKHAPRLARQHVRPENWAFVSKGVLLVGINLVGGRVHDAQEWQTRHAHNADWVRAHMKAQRDKVRAAVVFAQADPNKTHESFTKPFGQIARDFGKPVLYLHADGHVWKVENPWMAPNLMRVQTDMIATNPPVQVTVTEDPKQPFVFDRRLQKK